jgi:hypothetical protein
VEIVAQAIDVSAEILDGFEYDALIEDPTAYLYNMWFPQRRSIFH